MRRAEAPPDPIGAGGALPPFAEVLRRHRLHDVPESAFPSDGWSGARLALRERDGERFVIKRDALAWDWIARSTLDGPVLREAWFAASGPSLPELLWAPYHGAGLEGPAAAILMPDLTGVLLPWEAPADASVVERSIAAMVALHAHRWPAGALDDGPWCPLRERLLLLSRPAAERYRAEGNPVGARFLAGWDAFDALVDPATRALVEGLAADPTPLVHALGHLPATLLHGDLKLANVGFASGGRVALIDWQMVTVAPIALDVGWYLVSNAPSLPFAPEELLRRYRIGLEAAGGDPGDWTAQEDLAVLAGLLLRGWRKGLDATILMTYPSGVRAVDDLAWWSARALEAADRRL